MQQEKIVLLKLNGEKYLPTIPKEMQKDKVLPLQSQFKEGTMDLIRGFNSTVERIVLPDWIGIQASDVSFAQKARDFWADINIIPTLEGIRLNVATEKKKIGTQTVAGEGGNAKIEDEFIDFPVNPNDYMVWQIALQSTRVANTPAEAKNNQYYDFYLVDLEEEKQQQNAEFDAIDAADTTYTKLTNESSIDNNMDVINQVLELLRDKGEAVDIDSLDTREKKRRLRLLKEGNPVKFVATVNDKSLAVKAKIVKLFTNGIITKEGDEYFDGETNIGKGNVAVAWFSKPENSQRVLGLDARLRSVIDNKRQ